MQEEISRTFLGETKNCSILYIYTIHILTPECFIDAAIAELTDKEVEALKEKGYIEIIDTTNYPDGDVSRDVSQNRARKWCKSGSSTGYTTLESYFSLQRVSLKIAAHERPSFFSGNLELPENT